VSHWSRKLRSARLRDQGFGWGLVDQGFSSATNFALAVLTGRALGPAGLGAVFIGFTLYSIALTLQRSLVTDPLAACSSTVGAEARRFAGNAALSVGCLWAVSASFVILAAALLIGGSYGYGILVLVPWLPAALLQDFWRNVLYRDKNAQAAARNDGVWFLVMAISAPCAWLIGGAWAIAGCWGVGALAGGFLGFAQTAYRPLPIAAALKWWRRDAWFLARWLGLESVAYSLAMYGTILVLAGLLGAASYGGLRAIQSVFGPLSLLVPAIALPGLPAIARAYSESWDAGRALALRIGGLVTALTVAYVALFTLFAGMLTVVFGDGFAGFQTLVVPIGLGQIALAAGAGFPLLLKAQGRGRTLFLSRLVGLLLTLAVSAALAVTLGLTGVAWGMFATAVITSAMFAAVTLRRKHERPSGFSQPAEQL
jgi:O-antigen/teichoic acid export membrane protein